VILSIVVVVAVVLTVVINAQKSRGDGRDPDSGHSPLIAELQTLRGDNGLYARPGLESLGAPSLFSSAYGLPVTRQAGDRPPAIDLRAARRLFTDSVKLDGVAAYLWYARVVGPDVLASDQSYADRAIALAAEQDEGLEKNLVDATSALEVAELSGTEVPHARRTALAERLEAGLRSPNPFLRCEAATGLSRLDIASAERLGEVTAEDVEAARGDILRLYGVACLIELTGTSSSQVSDLVLGALSELTAGASPEDPFDAYYFTQAWEWAGGGSTVVEEASRALQDQIDPSTGLLRELVMRIGTLDTTFDAVSLAAQHGQADGLLDADLDAALQQAVVDARERDDHGSVLTAIAVYRLAGRSDLTHLEPATMQWAVDRLKQPVPAREVLTVARLVRLMEAASMPVPDIRTETLRVTDDESRYQAWLAVGLADDTETLLEDSPDIKRLIRETPVLIETGHLSAMEIAVAMNAAEAVGVEVDRNVALDALEGMRGCPEFEYLYRPSRDEVQCDVGTTVQLAQAGLVAVPTGQRGSQG
jgi:hypothetical protein